MATHDETLNGNTDAQAAHQRQLLRRRASVRLPVFFVVLLISDIGGQLGLAWTSSHAPRALVLWAMLGAAIILAAALIGIYKLLVKRMEGRQAHEILLRPSQALAGALFGAALFSVVLGVIHLAGGAEFVGLSSGAAAVPFLAMSILAAVGEELAFRGALFRILEDSRGTLVALLVSAAIFGLLHALNPGATVVSSVAIAVEAGFLLGAAYMLTRNLWFPIGLHFGWNFTEGGIFGTSVSGSPSGKGVFAVALKGPTLLTGGAFGPEASVIAMAIGLGAGLALIAISKKSRWSRRSAPI